jgi:hypothetical protein
MSTNTLQLADSAQVQTQLVTMRRGFTTLRHFPRRQRPVRRIPWRAVSVGVVAAGGFYFGATNNLQAVAVQQIIIWAAVATMWQIGRRRIRNFETAIQADVIVAAAVRQLTSDGLSGDDNATRDSVLDIIDATRPYHRSLWCVELHRALTHLLQTDLSRGTLPSRDACELRLRYPHLTRLYQRRVLQPVGTAARDAWMSDTDGCRTELHQLLTAHTADTLNTAEQLAAENPAVTFDDVLGTASALHT